MRYNTKNEAQIAAENVACGQALWIGPAFAKAYGVNFAGWYVVSLGKVH